MKELKKLINSHKIISFDIFDTLLLRPYVKFNDLFTHLEKLHKNAGFAKRRVSAEMRARKMKPYGQEVNIDEIYANLSGADKKMKQEELALEAQVLQLNPQIAKLFNYAKAKKKEIFIISDMYLSTKFLENVLAARGINGYKRLYVSSQSRKCKATSELFKHILEKENINPAKMLHIGDNSHSDYKQAKAVGINAFLYITPLSKYLKIHKKQARLLTDKDYSFNASVIMALSAFRQITKKTSYFETLGYETAGPAAYGFAKFIEKTALKYGIRNVFFPARDGYVPYRIFKTFNNKLNSRYVYVLRFMLKNKSYERYLKKIVKNLNILITDSITFYFTAQKLIKNAINKNQKLFGAYWSAQKNPLYSYDTFLPISNSFSNIAVYTRCWAFMEFIFSESAPPVQGVNAQGKSIYKTKPNSFEKANIASQTNVLKGELSLANDIKNIFGKYEVSFSGDFLVKWVNIFLSDPQKERFKELRNAYHASDAAHQNYYPIFIYNPKRGEIFKNFRQYVKFSRRALWKTPFQRLISLTSEPIVIAERLFAKLLRRERIEIRI